MKQNPTDLLTEIIKIIISDLSVDGWYVYIEFNFAFSKKEISTKHHKYLLMGAFTGSVLLTFNVMLLYVPFATDKLQFCNQIEMLNNKIHTICIPRV